MMEMLRSSKENNHHHQNGGDGDGEESAEDEDVDLESAAISRAATVFKAKPVPSHVHEPILRNMIQENPQRFNKKSRAYLTRLVVIE